MRIVSARLGDLQADRRDAATDANRDALCVAPPGAKECPCSLLFRKDVAEIPPSYTNRPTAASSSTPGQQ